MDKRIHRATSKDGTRIVGLVEGEGPPLVFVNAALGDAELNWTRLVPILTDRFACYRMSTRGRGASGDDPDHSQARLVEDIAAFAASTGGPVGLVGHSAMGGLALAAAAETSEVCGVAVYETPSLDHARADEFQTLVGEAAAGGDRAQVVRTVFGFVAGDEERAAMEESGYVRERERYVPVFLEEAAQGAYRPVDAAALERIAAPVLFITGSRSPLADLVEHSVARFESLIDDFRVAEIPEAGHFGHQVQPEAVAEHLTEFFADVQQRA